MALTKYRLEELLDRNTEYNTQLKYSIANVRGVLNTKGIAGTKVSVDHRDLSKFIVVRPRGFIFNHRVHDKLGLGYNTSNNTYIFTNDYVSFYVKPEIIKTVLLPDYLYIWYLRPEFDRYMLYKTYGSATLFFNWDNMCELEIELPDLLTQKKYVGFVNSLVEQEHVKVLLVANENELIQYEPIVEETQDKQEAAELLDRLSNHSNRRMTETSQKYLNVKEKTISDTIIFEGDVSHAIKNILLNYRSDYLARFTGDREVEEILRLLEKNDLSNLRTFIFACQKAEDIFKIIKPNGESDIDFINTIFYSIISFSGMLKSGERVPWNSNKSLSVNLSSEKYPLFHFCYDYIMQQSLDVNEIGGDRESIEYLLDGLTDLEQYEGYDKIQRMQIHFFIENLMDVVKKL